MLRALESRFELFGALRTALGATLQPIEKAQDFGRSLLRRWRPSKLARPIVPLILGNPDLGRQIYRNRFVLAGHAISGVSEILSVDEMVARTIAEYRDAEQRLRQRP